LDFTGPEGLVFDIPGSSRMVLRHLVLDLNGTLALDGRLLPGVAEALVALKDLLAVHIVTADTFGTAASLSDMDGVRVHRLPSGQPGGEAKAEFVVSLGPDHCAVMGNGANDAAMMRKAALGIAVLGPEGCVPDVLAAAAVVVRDPVAGFELLLYPKRLAATLRP